MLLRRELMVLLTSQAKPPIRSTPLLLSTPTRPPFTRSSVEIATFYFHFVTIKRGFLLPTLKTKKKEMAPLAERRSGVAPQHRCRSHWSGPPSALSPCPRILPRVLQGRTQKAQKTPVKLKAQKIKNQLKEDCNKKKKTSKRGTNN